MDIYLERERERVSLFFVVVVVVVLLLFAWRREREDEQRPREARAKSVKQASRAVSRCVCGLLGECICEPCSEKERALKEEEEENRAVARLLGCG